MAYFDNNLNHWVADVTVDGKRYRSSSKKLKTKKLALEWERNKKVELDALNHVDYTLQDMFNIYVQDNKVGFKYTTIAKYLSNLKLVTKLNAKLAQKKVSDITVKDLVNFQNKMYEKQYSAAYINRTMNSIRTVLNHAMLYYGLKSNPAIGIKKVKDHKIKTLNYYTLEQYREYESHIDDLKFKTFFNFLYFTGVRKGEAIALNWGDIDFAKKTVMINKTLSPKKQADRTTPTTPKTQSSIRRISLPDETLDLLKQLYELNKTSWHYFDNQYFVFGSTQPLKESNIDRHNRKYATLANLHHIRIHDFRTSHTSFLINAGANILMVSKRLGHSDIEMTLNTYSFLFDESENEVLKMINKLQKDSQK